MKQETKCYCGHTTYCDCGPEKPKQETLEEVAIMHAFNFYEKEDREVGKQSFIEGAKWQQENILQLLKDNDYQDEAVFELLTEQFKNK